MKQISHYNSFFILGIKGVAMANIALILKKMGKQIEGIDTKEKFITDSILKENKIMVITDAKNVDHNRLSDVYIYSAAHNGRDNPIIMEASRAQKIIISQAEFIEKLRETFPVSIAVSGCHGKTTTSALLAYTLTKLHAKPSYIIGTSSFQGMTGGNFQKDSNYFIFEADEYGIAPPKDIRSKLLIYKPQHIICTNIDFDHPDVYKNINDVKKTFLSFFSNRKLYVCADDPNIQSVLPKLKRDQYRTFGFSPDSDLRLTPAYSSETITKFYVHYQGKKLGLFSLPLFGRKNISNAGGVILILLELGFSVEHIKNAIVSFEFVKRRFELVYKKYDITLFDDYAHHPAEITATIQAMRERFDKRRIIILFQPHTFSRTQAFKKQIIITLSKADIVYIAPIFSSARENSKSFTIDSHLLRKEAELLKVTNVHICDTKSEILTNLSLQLIKNDIIVTMGAGDIYKLKNDIIKLINLHKHNANLSTH